MKSALFISIIWFTTYSAQAQLEKGTFAVGGNLSTGIWQLNAALRDSKLITPSIGIFVKNNVLVGVGIPLTFMQTDFDRPELLGNIKGLRSRNTGLSLFTKRYFTASRFKPFIQADVSYNRGTTTFLYTQSLPKRSINGHYFNANLGLGFSYFITNQISLEATAALGIASLKTALQNRELDPSNRYLLLGAGANWYWGGRQKTNP